MEATNGVYKVLTGFLSGALVVGLSQWLIFGREVVTRSAMEYYVQSYSPYAKDKSLIEERLKEDETYWKQEQLYEIELDKRLRELENEVSEVRAQLKLPHRKIAELKEFGGGK